MSDEAPPSTHDPQADYCTAFGLTMRGEGPFWRDDYFDEAEAFKLAVQKALRMVGATPAERWAVIERAAKLEADKYAHWIATKAPWRDVREFKEYAE